MENNNIDGLRNIARSRRDESASRGHEASAGLLLDDKPLLQFEGRVKKTSVAFDAGMWRCAEDLAFVLTRKLRATGSGRVTISKLFVAAFKSFYDKSEDDQLELIRKHL